MRRLLLFFLLSVSFSSLSFSQADANRRYVAVEKVSVKSSTGFFSEELGTLPLGEEVTVLREDGKRTQIRAGNLTGWVNSADLSKRRVVASGSSVTGTEVALAGKGFSPAIEEEYKKNGLDYSTVDTMERTAIPAAELRRFINEGGLAGGE